MSSLITMKLSNAPSITLKPLECTLKIEFSVRKDLRCMDVRDIHYYYTNVTNINVTDNPMKTILYNII